MGPRCDNLPYPHGHTIMQTRGQSGDAHLETGEAQEEAGTHPNLIHKVPVASFNSLAYIAHDMHAQDLHCPQLNISWKLLEVGKVLNRLQLLAWGPLYMHAHTDMSTHHMLYRSCCLMH